MPTMTEDEAQINPLLALDKALSEVAYLRRREADIIEACERVTDGGQYRADIVSAIQRIRQERDMLRVELDNTSTVLDAAKEALGEVRGVCEAGDAELTVLAARRVRDEAEEMRRQRNVLAQAIADTAEKAGGYNGTSPLTGPHLLLLLKDLGEEFDRLRSIESSHKG